MSNQNNPVWHPNRRSVLEGASAVAGLAFLRSTLPQFSAQASSSPPTRPTLIVVFLRGGADALSWVAPVADSHYINRRPTIQVPAPPLVATDPRWLDFNRRLALPEAAINSTPGGPDITEPFGAGHLTFAVGTGLTCTGCGSLKSHFEMMNLLESGTTPGQPINTGGWFGRYLQAVGASTGLRGISHGPLPVRSLEGAADVLPIADVQNFPFFGRPSSKVSRKATIANLSALSPASGAYTTTANGLLDAQALLESVPYTSNPDFPATPFGQTMRKTADLLAPSSGPALEAIHLNYGGWDHHESQGVNPTPPGTAKGDFFEKAEDVSRTLGAFYRAMGSAAGTANYHLIVVSEFGRRAFENGSAGTDHGTGGIAIFMGAGVSSGSFSQAVSFPGYLAPAGSGTGLLSPGVLINPTTSEEDLATGVDIRELIGEVLVKQQQLSANQVFNGGVASVFPGFPAPASWHGIVG